MAQSKRISSQKISSQKTETSPNIQFLKKLSFICIFIYFLAISYRNLRINGVNYGIYLQPIASIPFWLIFIVDFFIQYIIQKGELRHQLTLENFKNDVSQAAQNLLRQHPLTLIKTYYWQSFKLTVKRFFIALLMITPIMLIFGIIQWILTGEFHVVASY